MSDDEVARRRGPWLALASLLLVLGGGLWLRGQVTEDSRAFQAFCSATHVGEPWEHVLERAAAKGWGFVRQSRSAAASSGTLRETAGSKAYGWPRRNDPADGQPAEEWLCQVEIWSYRAGCVVTVARGRVISRRFAELP